ncbi:MFS transporter [Altererythrobacter aquaemixtae]|uniref:MFS transporter n=2 Tax=Pontixanthobacter aquaemixtae TaxID=1958940 RepID=A0A844ZQW3_9SPHN|nr:MFS transporter [Pontixanthobacter aquaemixtae]
MTAIGARSEWGKYWTLPIAAALGYATSVIHIYGLGPFVVPISEAFDWPRTTVTFGITIATLISGLFAVPIGMLVDRVGPRPIGIAGVALLSGAFALIGFAATGDEWNWYLLWAVLAFATLPVQATIWTAAVATRFEASRGLAFAITLCGASTAQALFPWLGTTLIAAYGWQQAMIFQGAIWAAIALPVIILFFRGARDVKAQAHEGEEIAAAATPGQATGFSFLEGLKSTVYVRLLVASVLFTFVALALVVNFIPIQTDSGMEPTQAGALAFWIGIFAIIGRLGTGFLLDRLPGNYVGAAIFCLPILACISFLYLGTDAAFLSAALIGLTVGAEVDVIVYLATRHFGLKAFGALYGGLLVALSIGTATGPLYASSIFDNTGNYDQFFWISIGCMAVSVICLATLPRPAFGAEK